MSGTYLRPSPCSALTIPCTRGRPFSCRLRMLQKPEIRKVASDMMVHGREKTMSRRQRLCGTAIALAVMLGPTIAAADTERGDTLSVRPFEYVPSPDTTPVEVQMPGIRWRVPRNFLEVATFSRSEIPGGWLRSAVLRIVTTLSTLKEQVRKRYAASKPSGLKCALTRSSFWSSGPMSARTFGTGPLSSKLQAIRETTFLA